MSCNELVEPSEDDGAQASNLVKWHARHVTEQLVEGAAVGSGGPNMTLV
jgi:hypothetical protein